MTLFHHSAALPTRRFIHMNLPGLVSQLDQAMGLVDSSARTSSWVPRVDILETSEAFIIQADVPGVSPEGLEVHMDKDTLIIEGERVFEARDKDAKGVRTERQAGKFQRRFLLPDAADAANIQASCEHGVLEVVVPKRPEEQPRRVPVSVRASSSKPDAEQPED